MIEDSSLPRRCTLAVGSKFMLLLNFVVELGMMNGSIGTIHNIKYCPGEKPPVSQPAYVIVEFPYSKLETSLITGIPNTFFPVPVVTTRCERKCCSSTQIPLRVYKAITIYNSQGRSIGEGQTWEYVVVNLTEKKSRSRPGLEKFALSRATSLDTMAILDDTKLSYDQFVRIGRGASYDKRREFKKLLHVNSTKYQ